MPGLLSTGHSATQVSHDVRENSEDLPGPTECVQGFPKRELRNAGIDMTVFHRQARVKE